MVHILGIRHHGPGSAANVKRFLETVKPDIVLVEGPPDADGILQWAGHAEIKPPVAILAYQSDRIEQSLFYPFAEFSPEWQAVQYAQKKKVHVRFMDLPLAHHFALENEAAKNKNDEGTELPANEELNNSGDGLPGENEGEEIVEQIKRNPISWLSEAAGYDDPEKWWEHTFEHRVSNEEVFEAVQEAMAELRSCLPARKDRREQLREAYMRKIIRQAEKEMFQNIAVICGAWHAPALSNMPKQKDDNELLKNLPKVKVDCTWIPWTYSRLSYYSGYGAGIHSPGWYHHIWRHPNDDGTRWMAKVAKLFRERQMDTSVAHVIEAVRLAGALASLRNLSKAGLEELNEATLSVLCNGEQVLMQLVHDELIVSNRIGEVPVDIPKPPLQVDIERQQKKLRLPPTADWKDYLLDLRKENDLERSIFLHRLLLLNISWGTKSEVSGKGTFKEQWRLQWDPAFTITIIEKGALGNTLEEAANSWAIQQCEKETSLKHIAGLLEQVIPAELSRAAASIAQRINNMAALSNDIIEMVAILPGLVGIMRYGNVRKTDAEMVRAVAESLITRVCIGLPAACCGIDEDTAASLTEDCVSINQSIQLLQEQEYLTEWHNCLQQVAYQIQATALMRGFAARQLMDAKWLQGDILFQLFYSSISRSLPVAETAAWLEGFLKGSGTVLLLDDDLWQMVNGYVQHLEDEAFMQVLPLLRRTFSNFTPAEKRKMGEKVKTGGIAKKSQVISSGDFDNERAKKAIPVVMSLMGYKLD
ncbi:DUF5682 family protein [Foetidibacter luteolus]|uniref:DUF5682 family protein n=1 Tax=Foetidibacter luteolus TaxID=2608880 RepID=UPI00129ACA1B|nr:DUF5682 family protein [Foetidibacter luteolus]